MTKKLYWHLPCLLLLGMLQTLCLGLEVRVDYRDNHPATNRVWYYQEIVGGLPSAISGGGTFYDAFGEQATGFSSGAYDAPGVVYTRGDEVKVRFWIDNAGGPAHSGTVTYSAGGLGSPPAWFTGGTVNYTVGANSTAWTAEVSLGTLPNTVATYTVPLNAVAQDSGLTISGGGFASMPLYATYADPIEQMNPVWLEVVGMSCAWASGDSASNDVIDDVTEYLYYPSGVFYYNLATGADSEWTGDTIEEYKLKQFLNEYYTYGQRPGNCVDISSFLHLLLCSQGIESDLYQETCPEDPEDEEPTLMPFVTNLVCPIGYYNIFSPVYYHLKFIMHQQCWTGETNVNDAALAFQKDLSWSSWGRPALRWPYSDYWQKNLGGSPVVYAGLTFRLLEITDTVINYPSPPPFYRVIPYYGPDAVDHTLSAGHKITALVE